jgi:type IV pilus assembly protein PilQ
VTLRLKEVPWDQALDIILKTKGLAMRRSGNVILVAPSDEIAAREKLELEARKQQEELAPVRAEFIEVNFAKAGNLADLIKAEENFLLSPRGNVKVDERTNTLLVVDTPERLSDIRKLIARLDIPVRQVLIESRIVIASNDFSKDLGVRFGVSKRDTMNNKVFSEAVTSGSLNGTTQVLNRETVQLGDRLNVNLPVRRQDAARIALALTKFPLGNLLELELSALQAEGRGEVISNPRVITSNKQKAVIEQGTEIPFQQATSSGATAVQFKKAVLSLEVEPQITPDDKIIMQLTVNKDSVGQVFNGVPSVNTRKVSTEVLVENGQTVVLGGIYEQEQDQSIRRVPFLGDLPYIGTLFRDRSEINNKVELLIFVTPKIVKEGVKL